MAKRMMTVIGDLLSLLGPDGGQPPTTSSMARADGGLLSAGEATVWLCVVNGGFNIDWFELVIPGIIGLPRI